MMWSDSKTVMAEKEPQNPSVVSTLERNIVFRQLAGLCRTWRLLFMVAPGAAST